MPILSILEDGEELGMVRVVATRFGRAYGKTGT